MSEILLGIGLEDIKFGMHRKEVEAILGKPSDVELYSYSETEDDLTEVWHYDELEFSLSFDDADDWKMIMIADSNDNHTLNDNYILGKTFEEVVAILEELKLTNFDIDEVDDEGKVIKIEEKSLNIWFDKNQASEIQWGPLWSDEDAPIFP